jgi:hypothetical protein
MSLLCYGRATMASDSPVCPMRDTCEWYRRAVFGAEGEQPVLMLCGPDYRMRIQIDYSEGIEIPNDPSGCLAG